VKIHVLGVPHTQTREEFTTCAFTMKVFNLCKMMHRRGHEVIHYGVAGSTPECSENVAVISEEKWRDLYGHPGKGFYNLDTTGKFAPYHAEWAANCKAALLERSGKPKTEIVALPWGGTQREACVGLDQFLVESGIGYRYSWSDWRVYESYAWLHMHLGEAGHFDGSKWYWVVIPNAFDTTMFDFNPDRGEDFLYIGRLNADKGVSLAIDAAREAGRKITIVGQGDPAPFLSGNPHASYLPPVGVEGRRKLMSEARAVFTPSFYVEPFCGVAVEAQLSGAPVISTDWGVFPEHVLHGKTGYRCRTPEQFAWAAKNIDRIDPYACHEWAKTNFSLERVAVMYEEYFQQVLNVRCKGFYQEFPERAQLDWLDKSYPYMNWEAGEIACADLDTKRPHIEPVLVDVTPKDEWTTAQDWERCWWGLEHGSHWDDELKKQEGYFRLMGFPDNRDFGDKSILDVGCGPISTLTRTKHGFARGVDPLAVSEKTLQKYKDAGVEFLNIKAEEMPVDREFDEVWNYNVLQHTQDPHLILSKIAAMAKVVRIFEWVDLGICPGHPQNLTEDMFWQHFGTDDYERPIWNVGCLRDFGGTVTNKYIAIHAIKKSPTLVARAAMSKLAGIEKLADKELSNE
jgi:glycosyltransferase involved in cell wall biosynthesis